MKSSEALARIEKLESVLSGALQFGDRQANELIRLSRVATRQKRTLWQALSLLKRGRYDDAIVALKAECRERRDREPAR
jgi:hypothetical protein